MTEIFASREKEDNTVSSKLILDELLKMNHKDSHSLDLEKIVKTLKPISKDGDIILTLGAGNIWRYSKELAEELK